MINSLIDKQYWYLVSILDQEGLPGKNIKKAIENLIRVFDFKYIVISDIEGAGISHLKKNEILPIYQVLNMISEVKQFDWGDFYLFRKCPENFNTEWQYPYIISQADATVRAIDDTYINIYTQKKELVDSLKEISTLESIIFEVLNKLPYPT